MRAGFGMDELLRAVLATSLWLCVLQTITCAYRNGGRWRCWCAGVAARSPEEKQGALRQDTYISERTAPAVPHVSHTPRPVLVARVTRVLRGSAESTAPR